jgi:hypothetical protein
MRAWNCAPVGRGQELQALRHVDPMINRETSVNSMTRILAAIGVVALIGIAFYLFSESQKSDAEKLGDSIEEVGDDIADAVDDATN